MAATFRSMWSDLIASTPRLPPPLAQTLINRAFHDICDIRLWSWLVPIGYITTPASINIGTLDVTLGSLSVTASVDAAAALNAVVAANPPLASTQVGIGRQIRIASSGPLYNISAWNNGTRTLTLDRVYAEDTATAQSYICYKAYYQPPPSNGVSSPDFLRYFAITNSASGYTIRSHRLYLSQEQLAYRDPQRGSTGDPYFLANYITDPTSGNLVHEWWPHPVSQRVYSCIYQKRGLDLSDSNAPPLDLPSDLIMERAYQLACQWALKNVAIFPELQQTNWIAAMSAHEKQYKERLVMCAKQDDEMSPLKAILSGSMDRLPPGGAFLQSHDTSSWYGWAG